MRRSSTPAPTMRLAPKHQTAAPPRPSYWVPLLLVLAGVLVLLYPVTVTIFSNVEQRQAANAYSEGIEETRPEVLDQMLEKARQYNREIPGTPVLDPWMSRVAKSNFPYQAYLHQLDLLPQMGRLIIPAADVELPVYHGSEAETLERGIGHLYGSSLPVGGKDTHAVLTGHTGLPTATLLDNLTAVRKGDMMYVEVLGQKLAYKVFRIQVVLPDEVSSLKVEGGQDLLTVLTCTPYGINSHRLLVTGERVPLDEADFPSPKPALLAIQWWMWLALGVAILALALVLLRLGRAWAVQRRDANPGEVRGAGLGQGRGLGRGEVSGAAGAGRTVAAQRRSRHRQEESG